MAEPKVRFDDFVRNVHPDPAKPEPTILLSGFIGPGSEGHVRIYPDLSLNTWYEVAENDIVHSTGIPASTLTPQALQNMAHSTGILFAGLDAPQSGSHVWVRANAQITPGLIVAQATPGQAAQPGLILGQAAQPGLILGQAAPGQAAQPGLILGQAAQAQPGLILGAAGGAAAPPAGGLQPTPATHCFICPPEAIRPTPTGVTICCPPPPPHVTLDTLCTQLCTHVYPAAAVQPTPTVQTHCYICVPQQTLDTLCTMPPGCPQYTAYICPAPQAFAWGGVGASAITICCAPGGKQAPQAAAPQPTPTLQSHCFVCMPQQTLDTLCTMPPGCPQHTVHICPTPSAVQQCGGPGVTFVGCTPQCQGVGNTLATLCTHPGYCPTQAYVCPPGRGGVFTPYGG
jgi:hypothetical protein